VEVVFLDSLDEELDEVVGRPTPDFDAPAFDVVEHQITLQGCSHVPSSLLYLFEKRVVH
jgi:hypothetical protein